MNTQKNKYRVSENWEKAIELVNDQKNRFYTQTAICEASGCGTALPQALAQIEWISKYQPGSAFEWCGPYPLKAKDWKRIKEAVYNVRANWPSEKPDNGKQPPQIPHKSPANTPENFIYPALESYASEDLASELKKRGWKVLKPETQFVEY